MNEQWNSLHCGHLFKDEIARYVVQPTWQKLRLKMKGMPLEERRLLLERWLELNGDSRPANVQVTNYINALKRGGMLK